MESPSVESLKGTQGCYVLLNGKCVHVLAKKATTVFLVYVQHLKTEMQYSCSTSRSQTTQ